MIITSLMSLFVSVLHVLFLPLQLIDIPPSVASVFQTISVYLEDGCKIVVAYTHFSYLLVLLDFVILMDSLYTAYLIIMWILRKVPMWGIS